LQERFFNPGLNMATQWDPFGWLLLGYQLWNERDYEPPDVIVSYGH
jgi:hypothetical protein